MTLASENRTANRRSRVAKQGKPALHPDVYPVGRVSTEFFLRGFEFIGQLHGDIVSCLIIMTLWRDALTGKERSEPMGIRELSRRLDFPFETVRRHVRKLVQSGTCLVEEDRITLSPTLRRSARMTDVLRKIYLHAVRMLGDLGRIKVASYKPSAPPSRGTRHLDKEQTVIAIAAMDVLLAAMKVLRGLFDGDLMNGLVFTAIRAANVKHITNTDPVANREILPNSRRLPVSMMAISDSMRLPYETVRRHAGKLVKDGKCIRVGRLGLMAPSSTFEQMTIEAETVRQLVLGFLSDLKKAGIKV